MQYGNWMEYRSYMSVDCHLEEQNIQKQLDNISRNKAIYEKVSTAMRAKGLTSTTNNAG